MPAKPGRPGLVHVQDRHAEDRARLVVAGGGVGDVVGADHPGDVGPREVGVDAARHGVGGELHVHAPPGEEVVEGWAARQLAAPSNS